jgi:hypothetical protein
MPSYRGCTFKAYPSERDLTLSAAANAVALGWSVDAQCGSTAETRDEPLLKAVSEEARGRSDLGVVPAGIEPATFRV